MDVDCEITDDRFGNDDCSYIGFGCINVRIAGFQPDFGFAPGRGKETIGIDVFLFPFVQADQKSEFGGGGIQDDRRDLTVGIAVIESYRFPVFTDFP